MGEKRNYAALDWVIGEIGETLKEARQSLEAYVEDPRDKARIGFCLTLIHQVHGSLQMAEFHGASLFAEEMELLTQALMDGKVSNEKEAQEVLMRSLLQLPIYLDQVKAYHEDHPGSVLPLLNDVRAVRKQSFLSETNLFNPDLSSLDKIKGRPHPVIADPAKLKPLFKKLREMYRYAAAGVLRGVKIDENLGYLDKVFARLENMTRGTRLYPVWQISAALGEALQRDDVELSVAVRGLLRQLAGQLKVMEDHCPAALHAPPRENLVRNLLYYVARAEQGGERVAAVKQQYQLAHALLGGSAARSGSDTMLQSPEPGAIRAVVVALQDELNTVKHLLDLSLSGQGGLSDVEEMLPVVKRIGDTLAVLGIGDMRKLAMDQHHNLIRIVQSGNLSDSMLIDVAGRMADLEHRLEAIARGAGRRHDYATADEREVEIDSAKEAVLNECRVGLESVKDAIVESMSSKWNPDHLPPAVATIHHIRGGLNMVPLQRPALILETCGRFIEEQLVRRDSTPGQELQTLAEALASLDYFLERLTAGHVEDIDTYLDMAEESLGQLGYSVDYTSMRQDSAAAPSAEKSAEEEPPVATTDSDSAPMPSEADQAEETIELAEESDSYEVDAYPMDEPASETAEAESSAEAEDDDSEIDDEIVEIFIEEANEVQETLGELFPKWRDDMSDAETLTDVRRAFHTLKGSGRMVEATDVGELAWAVENMLNRVLDETVPAQSAHADLIDHVLQMVPALIEAFKNRTANPDPERFQTYIDWAGQLAKGEVPPDLDGAASHGEVQQMDADASAHDTAAEATPVPEATAEVDDNDDQVLWEIFASEAKTHLAVLDEFIAEMDHKAPLYTMPSDALQRALHTLKGSAHMAGVTPVAAMITPLEGFVKELRSYQIKIDQDILQLLKDAAQYTRDGLDCIDQQRPVELPKQAQFIARVDELHAIHIAPLIHSKELAQRPGAEDHKQVDPRLLSILMAEEMSLLLDADVILRRWQAAPETTAQEVPPLMAELQKLAEGADQANLPPMHGLAQQLAQIYQRVLAGDVRVDEALFDPLRRAHDSLLDMVDSVAAGQNLPPVSEDLQQQLQALAAVPEPAAPQEDETDAEQPAPMFEDGFSEVEIAQAENEQHWDGADEVEPADAGEGEAGPVPGEGFEDRPADTDEDSHVGSTEGAAEYAAESTQDYAAESSPEYPADGSPEHAADGSSDNAAEGSYEYPADGSYEYAAEGSQDHAAEDSSDYPAEDSSDRFAEGSQDHTAEGSSDHFAEDSSDYSAEGSSDHAAEGSQDHAAGGDEARGAEDSAEVIPLRQPEPEDPEYRAETVEVEEADYANGTEDEEYQVADDGEYDSSDETGAHFHTEYAPPPDTTAANVDDRGGDAEETGAAPAHAAAAPTEVETGEAVDMAAIEAEDFDADIIEIFLEEANELIEELDEAIHDWESDWNNLDSPETMKRALHTLKGGARLSGLKNLGELTHDYESYLIATTDPNGDPNFFPVIHRYQDVLLHGLRAVRAKLDGEAAPEPIAPPAPPTLDEETAAEVAAQEEAPAASAVVPFTRERQAEAAPAEPAAEQMPAAPSAEQSTQTARRQGPQEVIKVPADLLEELVNLAGETSISRGRLEQQVSDLGSAVDEVDGTLRRMNEQLRRLDIETEAQVLFRQEQMAAHEQFDPLEMDRYSQLQQLTRSLMESASDLVDLKSTLSDKLRDTETMLLQQQRINSSLQEGLMRSRMVPFSRLVPRLRRIVRQISGELGKHVNFELDNVEGEMDRSVLERMVAPLEHMLRNAVDHGIESPAEREAQGKPETGRILLSLAREGGDILLRLTDDGRGIHLDRVREKAVERGLMADDAKLTDHDIMQFILQAGFSTAENVTQISGRGVGMDVVAAEIKQLGGSMVIDSKTGQGTQFTVRLPFTVSVNRALMVQLGSESYAIPLNTIEGIVRVSPFELEHYYSHPEARFEYAGENYQVRHLGAVLTSDIQPKLDGQLLPLPVILVRSAQHTMALQVDSLLGSREIVVKSLGPQFAAVQGVSGATVMGDGSVVIIIDPHALVRREMAHIGAPMPTPRLAASAKPEEDPHKTVMVVDDSVTVRKVTTRFLEREGFNVVTAKDGVDALQMLQEGLPDLMLLDIEMPRMDGFEVAKNIRSSTRLKHIPIIMITSRTGEKHRRHALSIGVNDYLGKPYQEEALLKTMHGILGTSPVSA